VRQGEVASQGKWTGSASGGVKPPEALVLPDPGRRFADTAKRLEALATGHPMQEWLRFMMELARAQHVAATTLGPLAGLAQSRVEQAVAARIPPLAPDGYRPDAAWRDGLVRLLDGLDAHLLPRQGRAVIARLRENDTRAPEALADGFLQGEVEAADAGAAVYVAAALQVYFTRMAASLPASSLRLLPDRGMCPCCGSTPIAGLVTASGRTPGARYLYCSLCSTAWNHVRAVCITCDGARALSLKGIDGDSGTAMAETCGDCRTYSKVLYQARDMTVDPFADDLATLGLDLLVAEAGWSRHAPNPLILIGQM
jgi:FdhE protein